MKTCIFCQIVRGEEPRHHIWEDERYLALLTHRPLKPGHLMIIPKQHVDYFFDMDHELYMGIFAAAEQLHPAIKKASGAVRVGLGIEGFGIAHAHLHLIPMFDRGGLDSTLAYDASQTELKTMSKKLRDILVGSRG